ncbi:MAG: GAF domain-containing protein [Bryobacteraceae bacterium]
MVKGPIAGGLRCGRVAVVFAALLSLPAAAQKQLTLEEVGVRKLPDYSPAHGGEAVTVRGVVSAPAYHFPGYALVAIDDGRFGAVVAALQAPQPDTRLDGLHPGEEIEVVGTVSSIAGEVIIRPERIAITGRKEPPAPAEVSVRDLEGFRYLGRLVHTTGRVVEIGDTTAGDYSLIATPAAADYRIFFPRAPNQPPLSAPGYKVGDTVEATGVALQYCPYPPYNQRFELLAADPAEIVIAARSWFIPPLVLAAGIGVVLVGSFLLWTHDHRLRKQRERLRKTYQLVEEILGASSVDTILKRITEVLPGILGVTRVQLYIYNRGAKTLDAVAGEAAEPVSIPLASPPGGARAGAVACFHYRTLLVIPDIVHSPFPMAAREGAGSPKSLLFVPMLAQGEVTGVLELDQDDRLRDFTADEQALAQHLGNQIGVAVRLLDQRSVQEQLSRTEKLAAIGRLISGVVNELQTPLSSISDLAARAQGKGLIGPAEREVSAIAAEAQKAASMVARLVSFAAAEQLEARPVCITTLLRNLIEFREGDWKASGIRVRDLTSREPLYVLGSQGQLEQVFLNLFVHAEQSLADAPQKVITIRTSVLAKRLVVEVAFTASPGSRKPEENAAAVGVTRSVIAGHGGEVRLIESSHSDPHFEVELPATSKERVSAGSGSWNAPARDFSRSMTALLIEPDETAQRQMLGLLAARGLRVVPIANADAGLELSQRLRFDAAFCSVHAPGLNWVELSERMQSRVGAFILLSDRYDAELCADFEGDGRFVLSKPLQDSELEQVLRALEPQAPATVIPISKSGAA